MTSFGSNSQLHFMDTSRAFSLYGLSMRCMYMSKMAVVIDMNIQFIADLVVLFGVQF